MSPPFASSPGSPGFPVGRDGAAWDDGEADQDLESVSDEEMFDLIDKEVGSS